MLTHHAKLKLCHYNSNKQKENSNTVSSNTENNNKEKKRPGRPVQNMELVPHQYIVEWIKLAANKLFVGNKRTKVFNADKSIKAMNKMMHNEYVDTELTKDQTEKNLCRRKEQ